jgi:hypothetical protein
MCILSTTSPDLTDGARCYRDGEEADGRRVFTGRKLGVPEVEDVLAVTLGAVAAVLD